jgi:hypothetical protein
MNKSLRFFVIGALLIATACSKKTVSSVLPTTPGTSLNVQELNFENFQGKARMILRDANKERDVKAHIRIRKDSVIWMTFNVIGVQGGKALINKDSITIVSTIDKEYYVFDYADLSKRFNMNVNYEVIEAAMLGNLIQPRTTSEEVVQESSMYLLKQKWGTIDMTNFVNAASMKIEKVELKEGNSSNSLVINYSNFQPVADKLFPFNGTISLFYKAASGILNTTIIFEYNKAEVGSKDKIPSFNIPKRYVQR